MKCFARVGLSNLFLEISTHFHINVDRYCLRHVVINYQLITLDSRNYTISHSPCITHFVFQYFMWDEVCVYFLFSLLSSNPPGNTTARDPQLISLPGCSMQPYITVLLTERRLCTLYNVTY